MIEDGLRTAGETSQDGESGGIEAAHPSPPCRRLAKGPIQDTAECYLMILAMSRSVPYFICVRYAKILGLYRKLCVPIFGRAC